MPLEKQHTLAVVGLIAGLTEAMAIMAIALVQVQPIPNSIAALAGVCAGGLAGFLSQRNGGH